MFVDGIFVLGGAQSIGFEDVERVEVIKGPQSAYFGRATFAGAVNYITRDPAATLGGAAMVSYSPSFGSYQMSGTIEGPIAGDLLSGRLTGSRRHKGAQFTATDGGELGEESTDSVNLALLFRPAPGMRLKLRGSYTEDNDSAPASGYFSYADHGNCAVGTPVTIRTNAGGMNTSLRTPYQCGDIPYNAAFVDQNTSFITLPATDTLREVSLYDVLVNNSINDPLLADAPTLKRFGLTRKMVRLSAAFEAELTDTLSFTASAGYNWQAANIIRDTDGTPRPAGYQAVPYKFEDKSFEGRLRYENGSWLSASLGINHFRQDIRADTDNGVSVTNQAQSGTTISRNVASSSNNENDQVRTTGFFFGVDVKPAEWLTLTGEGRYQLDDYTKFGGNNATGILVANRLRSKNFTPRLIVSLHPTRDTTLYASYSIGVLPGTANTNFVALTPAQKAQVLAIVPDLPVTLDSEKLKSWEVGAKARVPELGLTLSLAGFTMDWDNIKTSSSIIVTSFNNPIFTLTVPGSARIRGFEFEGNMRATDQLSFRASAGYLDARFVDYANRAYNGYIDMPATSVYKADGNRLPRTPDWTASGSVTWEDALTGAWDYRLRGDVLYTGRQFTDETNLASLAGYTSFNFSAAVERGDTSVELFVRNAFGAKAWLTGRRFVDTSLIPLNFATAGQGSFVIPIDKREAGVTVRQRF